MSPFLRLTLRVIGYAAFTAALYGVVYYDATQQLHSERSWTERTQELLLLIMVIVSAWSAYRSPTLRAFEVLLAFVATISFVREFNNTLFDYVGPHAWSTLVALCFLPAGWYFRPRLGRLRDDILAVADTFGFGVLIAGTLLLHVFSRFYGANDIWRLHMGAQFDRTVARVAEESVELAAYGLLLIGVVELCTRVRREVTSASDLRP